MIKAIRKHLFAYIMWLLVAIFLVSFEFSYLTRIKDEEKINFFISSKTVDEEAFFDFIKAHEPDYLRSISYRNIDYERENDFLTVLSSYGKVDTDIFLIPLEALNKVEPQFFFFPLNKQQTNTLFAENLNYYHGENGLTYGFQINSPFFVDEGLEYYLFFAASSLHLGSLNDSQLDGAITLAKLFIN